MAFSRIGNKALRIINEQLNFLQPKSYVDHYRYSNIAAYNEHNNAEPTITMFVKISA